MARSKGISDRRVLWRHALRPSTLTLLTVAGLNVGTLIGGAVVVEVLFSIPGIGYFLGQAIFQRQYVALQSFVAIIAIVYVLVNFAVDVLYTSSTHGSAMPEPVDTVTAGAADHDPRRCPAHRSAERRGAGRRGSTSPGTRKARDRRHGSRLIWLVRASTAAPRSSPRSCRSTTPTRASSRSSARGRSQPGHILGGDGNGRDMLSRVIYGGPRPRCSSACPPC